MQAGLSKRGARRLPVVVALGLAVLLIAGLLIRRSPRGPRSGGGALTSTPAYTPVPLDATRLRVVDGDTLNYDGERIRLLGVDTPERAGSRFSGDQEPYASQATELLQAALDGARQVALVRLPERDRYGRVLGYLLVDGRDVGLELLAAGLAYETVSQYGDQGLSEYAAEILAVSRRAPAPAFERPSEWRRTHRRAR